MLVKPPASTHHSLGSREEVAFTSRTRKQQPPARSAAAPHAVSNAEACPRAEWDAGQVGGGLDGEPGVRRRDVPQEPLPVRIRAQEDRERQDIEHAHHARSPLWKLRMAAATPRLSRAISAR